MAHATREREIEMNTSRLIFYIKGINLQKYMYFIFCFLGGGMGADHRSQCWGIYCTSDLDEPDTHSCNIASSLQHETPHVTWEH